RIDRHTSGQSAGARLVSPLPPDILTNATNGSVSRAASLKRTCTCTSGLLAADRSCPLLRNRPEGLVSTGVGANHCIIAVRDCLFPFGEWSRVFSADWSRACAVPV